MTRTISKKNRNQIIVLQFIVPSLLILAVFVFFPLIKTIIMSFQNWHLISNSREHPFIAFENFKSIFSLIHFKDMVRVTLLYTFASVAGKMFLGLCVALLLNRDFRGRAFIRGCMLIPWAMPTVVVCNIFLIALDPNYGILNSVLTKLPFIHGTVEIFSGKSSSFLTVLLIGIWKNFPFISLLLLAALGGIPADYYDAASIDGASIWSQFTKITWPLIKPVWNTLLTLQILWTVKEFELIYLLTKGGPDNATNVIGIDIYLNAFRYYRVGPACAEGVLLLAFCLFFSVIYFKGIQREEKLS